MRDEHGRSKGFGFVCFNSSEAASKAKEEKHNKMNGTKPLYVALAQRKEDRQHLLTTRFMKSVNQMRMQGPSNVVQNTVYTPAGGYFMTPTVQNAHAYMPSAMPTAPTMRDGAPRWSKSLFFVLKMFCVKNVNFFL